MPVNSRFAWFLLALVVFLSGELAGRRLQRESVYADAWCYAREGRREVRTQYETRVDCVFRETSKLDGKLYAVEVDFADKWAEGIGQALHYGKGLNAYPGLVLIIEHQDECRFLPRVWSTLDPMHEDSLPIYADGIPIRLWVIGPKAAACREGSP